MGPKCLSVSVFLNIRHNSSGGGYHFPTCSRLGWQRHTLFAVLHCSVSSASHHTPLYRDSRLCLDPYTFLGYGLPWANWLETQVFFSYLIYINFADFTKDGHEHASRQRRPRPRARRYSLDSYELIDTARVGLRVVVLEISAIRAPLEESK